MNNNELLSAMSDMMDRKLDSIKNDVKDIKATVENNVIPRLEKLEKLEIDVKDIKTTVDNNVIPRLEKLEPAVERIEVTIDSNVIPKLQKLGPSVKKIELTMENDVTPRLQNIEDCYLTTFKRYQSGVNQIESIQSDVDVLKTVVTEHSEKLQKFA